MPSMSICGCKRKGSMVVFWGCPDSPGGLRQAWREGLLYLPVCACQGIRSHCSSVNLSGFSDKQVTKNALQGFNAPSEIGFTQRGRPERLRYPGRAEVWPGRSCEVRGGVRSTRLHEPVSGSDLFSSRPLTHPALCSLEFTSTIATITNSLNR
jgi:hypothetical protein